jgi:hypothetical protein
MKSIVSDAVYTLSNQMNQIELDRFNSGIAAISASVSQHRQCLMQHVLNEWAFPAGPQPGVPALTPAA